MSSSSVGLNMASFYQRLVKTKATLLDSLHKAGNKDRANEMQVEFEAAKKIAEVMTQVVADVFFSPFKYWEIFRRAAQG